MTSDSNQPKTFNTEPDDKGGTLIIPSDGISFPIRVELDDQGQDLLTLLIDEHGIIIDAAFQRQPWIGCEVHVGHLLETYEANPGEGCILYRNDASESGNLLKYRARQIYQAYPQETLQ